MIPDAWRTHLDRCSRGEQSPQITLMHLLLTRQGELASHLPAIDREAAPGSRLQELTRLARAQHKRIVTIEQLIEGGVDAAPGATPAERVAAVRALYDRLARHDADAACALYTLGDPALVDAATRELVSVIDRWAPHDGADVLDLGCGTARVARAIAPEAASVLALDASPAMVEQARMSCRHLANVEVRLTGGQDLRSLPDASFDLALAVDSFPYLVHAGVLDAHLADLARVLRPGGDLLVFNWTYSPFPPREPARIAAAHDFEAVRAGTRPFRLWDATAYHFRAPG